MPLFIKMSSDDIWGVRKSCAESLVALSTVISSSDRLQHLVPIFQKLAEDVSIYELRSSLSNFRINSKSNQDGFVIPLLNTWDIS